MVPLMATPYLQARLDILRGSQNSDGGWAYFPGKTSWIEPTAYATLALHGDPAADRAWKLLKSWQLPDGSWRPAAAVNESSWATSLCTTIAMVRGDSQAALEKGIAWLVGSVGAEAGWFNAVLARVGIVKMSRDFTLKGWPWKPGNSAWVEPTAHALVALKLALDQVPERLFSKSDLRGRITSGEAELVNVRCHDGGWNYGEADLRGIDLPSYPETTALALLGLQGHGGLDQAFAVATQQMAGTPSPLARAWLTIAMRLHGQNAAEPAQPPQEDLMITAIEALAAPDGNYRFMETPATKGTGGRV
jgi:hypothetical protein